VSDISIRFATPDDASLLLQLIRELAAYERAPNAVVATEEDLRRYGFGPERQFEALLAYLDGEPAGLALFHPRAAAARSACVMVSARADGEIGLVLPHDDQPRASAEC
jgi:hypothetical protein